MNLKISPKRVIKWVGWGLVVLLFLIFFIRVSTFETSYYNSRQGSERAVVEEKDENGEVIAPVVQEELIEEKPTEKEVYEYTVPADHPRYLTIPRLGVHARIMAVGVDEDGELLTPRNIFDVGWFDGSGKPGQNGTMIIDGHNGGPHVRGVFKNLPTLEVGDVIAVERGDGVVYNYHVAENVEVSIDEADAYMKTAAKSPVEGRESITLITCSGDWSQERGTYLSRQFVRAIIELDM